MKRLMVVLMFALAMGGGAMAQTQQPPVSEFVPQAQAPQQPELPAAPLLYGAYAFVWAVLLVYVFLLWRRVGKIARELTEVTRKLKI